MGLTKRELEEINEALQAELRRLWAENARLTSTLASATARNGELEALYARLERRYARLKATLLEALEGPSAATTADATTAGGEGERWP